MQDTICKKTDQFGMEISEEKLWMPDRSYRSSSLRAALFNLMIQHITKMLF